MKELLYRIKDNIDKNQKRIERLPGSLEILICNHNKLENLPPLPAKLHKLDFSFNPIYAFAKIPPSLKILLCQNNQLIYLPKIPPSLEYLDCSNNKLNYLLNYSNANYANVTIKANNNPFSNQKSQNNFKKEINCWCCQKIFIRTIKFITITQNTGDKSIVVNDHCQKCYPKLLIKVNYMP